MIKKVSTLFYIILLSDNIPGSYPVTNSNIMSFGCLSEKYAVFKSVFYIRLLTAAADPFLLRTEHPLQTGVAGSGIPHLLFMGRAGLDSRDDSACICGLPAGQNMSQGSLEKSPDMFSHPDGYIEPCDAFCV